MKGLTALCLLFIVSAVKFGHSSFQCSEEGYDMYLSNYPMKCGDNCADYKS